MTDGVRSPVEGARRAFARGIGAYVLGTLLVALSGWSVGAAFEVVAPPEQATVHYVLVSASFATLAFSAACAAACLLLLEMFVRRRSARPAGPLFSDDMADHLRPLRWLAISLLPFAALVLPGAARLAPVWYVLYDLRWGWWLFVASTVVRRMRLLDGWHLTPRRRAALAGVSLALAAPLVGVVFTEHLRFSGVLHGDEPKYLRFCENLYQGLGFDISAKLTMAEASGSEYPRIGRNLGLLARAIPEELSLLATDARRLVTGHGPPRLVGGEPSPAMFFDGKHPGTVYQMHNPGVSFVLLPAYVIDRRLTGSGVGYNSEFPSNMPALQLTLLGLTAAYALSLYGLLLAWDGDRVRAWALALLGTVILPVGAFTFQIYPEVPSGIILLLLVRALVTPRMMSPRAAVGYGLLAGFLPWLHVRFALAAVLAMGALLVRLGSRRREQWRLVLGAVVPLVLLSLYTYRLSGSLIPIATWGSDVPLSGLRMLKGVPAFALDRVWGLLPHSPLYLLALPGLGCAWRRRRWQAAFVVVLVAAVVVPASGHGFWAGGSTPGRYLVSVAPLLLVFVAEAGRCWSQQRPFIATAGLLALVSVETAVRYNLHHVKEWGPLVARAFAGWRPNLLFPSLGTETWEATRFDEMLLAGWLVAACVLVVLGWVRAKRIESRSEIVEARIAGPRLGDVAACVAALAGMGMLLAAGHPGIAREYLVPAKEARERALIAFAALDRCAVCYSSIAGAVPPTTALGNEAGFIDVRVDGPPPVSGTPVRIRVRPRTPSGEFMLGTVRIDFGDGTTTSYERLFGDTEERHVYQAAGDYALAVWARGTSDRTADVRVPIHVAAPSRPTQ